MKKILLIFIIYLLIPSNTWSSESVGWETYTLQFPAESNTENVVYFNFMGKKFYDQEKTSVKPLEKKDKNNMEIEEIFITKVLDNNSSGNREKVLELWNESERGAIAKAMESKEAFERNTALFKNIVSSKLISVIKYESFYLFCVEHDIKGIGLYMKLYPAIFDGKNYFMSNKLIGDVFYEKIVTDLLPYMKNIIPKR